MPNLLFESLLANNKPSIKYTRIPTERHKWARITHWSIISIRINCGQCFGKSFLLSFTPSLSSLPSLFPSHSPSASIRQSKEIVFDGAVNETWNRKWSNLWSKQYVTYIQCPRNKKKTYTYYVVYSLWDTFFIIQRYTIIADCVYVSAHLHSIYYNDENLFVCLCAEPVFHRISLFRIGYIGRYLCLQNCAIFTQTSLLEVFISEQKT